MSKKLYGVFVGSKWGMTFNRKTAINVARQENGEVRMMDNPQASYWDLPTFYACSEFVYKAKTTKDKEATLDDGIVILKAHNGDRAKNLEAIADKIDDLLNQYANTTLPPQITHQIKGYMEQLRIISDELNAKTTANPHQ